jgi:hypothetical protein
VTSDTDSDQGKTSFQLASFDQTGKVNVWTVVETSVGDAAGSETELGLGLGGRVSLMQANSGESANIANSAAGSDKVKTPLKKKPVKTVESKTDTSNIVSGFDQYFVAFFTVFVCSLCLFLVVAQHRIFASICTTSTSISSR